LSALLGYVGNARKTLVKHQLQRGTELWARGRGTHCLGALSYATHLLTNDSEMGGHKVAGNWRW